jgi:hypothetical protein
MNQKYLWAAEMPVGRNPLRDSSIRGIHRPSRDTLDVKYGEPQRN